MLPIDDFPSVGISRLRAAGAISPNDGAATILFRAGGVFTVALHHLKFPNRGGWSFFVCPCGRRCHTLRLHEGALACHGCLKARGFRYRVEGLSRPERAVHVASRLAARLNSDAPARLDPRPGRKLDRRPRLEAALARAGYVALRGEFRSLIERP